MDSMFAMTLQLNMKKETKYWVKISETFLTYIVVLDLTSGLKL